MAIIQCPECGKEISDEAKVCPGCGKPMKKEKEKKSINKLFIIIPLIVVVLCIAGFIAYKIWYRNSPNYIMDQYKEAYENKDLGLLKELCYTYNYFDISKHIISSESDNVWYRLLSVKKIKMTPTNEKEFRKEVRRIYETAGYNYDKHKDTDSPNPEKLDDIVVFKGNYLYHDETKWTTSISGDIYEDNWDFNIYLSRIDGEWKIIYDGVDFADK